ncbi:hypothetical protein ACHAXR_011313 [Thalassiosira sp. AJA248-18]
MMTTSSFFITQLFMLAAVALILTSSSPNNNHHCHAFSTPIIAFSSRTTTVSTIPTSSSSSSLAAVIEPPPGGISATTQEGDEVDAGVVVNVDGDSVGSTPSGEVVTEATKRVGINSRGAKMNEIDFTLAPTDVSLSRSYQMSSSKMSSSSTATAAAATTTASAQSLSLTRALNTASNRAVRRILLSRSWPSAEALNLSLRTVLMQQQQQQVKKDDVSVEGEGGEESDKMKCPVPRPILNILMNRRDEADTTDDEGGATTTTATTTSATTPRTSEEREKQWIQNQIAVFRDSYSTIPGYDQAEAYLESILYLATSGEESERINEVMEGGGGGGGPRLYVEPYMRILSVIQSVGVVLEEGENGGRRKIAKKLIDQDICLSMLDKIALANEKKNGSVGGDGDASSSSGNGAGSEEKKKTNPLAIPYDAAAQLAYDAQDPSNQSIMSFDDFKAKYERETVAMVTEKKKQMDEKERIVAAAAAEVVAIDKDTPEPKGAYEKGRKRRLVRDKLAFFSKDWKTARGEDIGESNNDEIKASSGVDADTQTPTAGISVDNDDTEAIVIKPDDLGGVLLSAEEPTMTRQLNALSNIVQRTLIFGGDQELLVLAETLDADKPAFIQRWYKADPVINPDIQSETRPGVQYLNSLIKLLRDCYTKGVLKEVTPTLPLTTGYQNAYGRLTASLIELGSGYVRPASSSGSLSLAMTTSAATAKYLTSTAPPKSAREELGRFAKWESAVRKNRENPYPDDLVGSWDVQDVVGTQTIGTTEVIFKPQGELSVKPPMQGLRWRLDPGPTHLDTCTFQVLSDDGAILQYKGFVDRGSRLEARISKRSVTMRGGVSFLMRDTEGNIGNDYWDDMVPMNYKSGTTKFIMSRNVTNGDGLGEKAYSSSSTGTQAALRCPPVAEGEREILNGQNGPVLVTKVAGSYYAVDATCPHLNLPMKKGKISVEEGKPTLTCSFHNSCFEMETGKCTKWVTGALGTQNEVISGIMSNLGNEQKDIVAYHVSEEDDGYLRVTVTSPETSKIAA